MSRTVGAEPLLIGIDVGTTNWKVVAYDAGGRERARFRRPAAVHQEPSGRAHYDPEELWQVVCEGLREVVRMLGGREQARAVRGLAVTSMGEAGVLVDAGGKPLCPAIAWFDPRTEPQGRFWREQVDPYRVYEITGFPPQYIASINKLMWLKEHEPDAFGRARRWLCMADYVAFRLCGEQAMDHSLASRTMAFDIRSRRWSPELLGLAGVPSGLMPPPVECGTALGRLRPDVAEATGLSPSAVVSAGGQDHWCGALAADVVRPGDALDSTGTAEAVILVLDRPAFSPELFASGFSVGCHTAPGRYYILGALQTAGATIEWLRSTLGVPEEQAVRESGESPDRVYGRLMGLAASAPPGSRGLLFLPHLRGAVTPPDALSRGAWVGLRPFHARAELVRSAVEGLSFEFAFLVGRLSELTGVPVHRVAAIGGGVRNELWLRLKADASNLALEVSAAEEATTLGAALLAGVGAGVFADVEEAADKAHRVARTVQPDPGTMAFYRPYRELYRELYPALASVSSRLEGLEQGFAKDDRDHR